MPQPPLKVDALEINPLTGSPVLSITRASGGGLQFNDATLASPVTLAQLVSSSITNVLVVSATGPGTYNTIQDALDAVPASPTTPYTILVYGGVYEESVAWSKPDVTLVGIGAVTITASTGTTLAITGEISASLVNITVENTGAGTCLTVTGVEDARVTSLTLDQFRTSPGSLAAAASLTYVNVLSVQNCHFGIQGSFLSTQTQNFAARNTVFPTLGISYSPGLNSTAPDEGSHYLQSCRVLSTTSMSLQGTATFAAYGTVTANVIFMGDSPYLFSGGSSATVLADAPATFLNHSVASITGTGPVDQDFNGVISFTGTSEAHTFSVPQSDANYSVSIQPMGRTAAVSSKLATGFTLTLDPTFTGTVSYRITR